MKKQLFISVILLAITQFSVAQNYDEWFRQKKTKIRRLYEQIAANKVYIEYAKKGYEIVTKGLHTIRDIKNGDFKLHLGFFDSLRVVNPRIRNSALVAEIITRQLAIIKSTRQAINAVRESGQFNNEELDYCKGVFDRLLETTSKSIDELFMVVTHGQLSMSDEDRISRIRQVYNEVQDQTSFVSYFGSEMRVLALQRLTEQAEINYSKKIGQ